MDDLHNVRQKILEQLPRLALEKRLTKKLKEAGASASGSVVSKAALHILSGNRETFSLGNIGEDVMIQVTDEDWPAAGFVDG